MSHGNDPKTPDYLREDLKRLLIRLAANEHWYEQSWLGVPIWQLPDDLMRLQEIINEIRPRWIVETGTKYGGSAIFFASMLELIGQTEGGVITVDILETDEASHFLKVHPHAELVRSVLVGDAASRDTADKVSVAMDGTGPVLVFLDDNHNAEHVLAEMEQYGSLVTPGSYLIVADTALQDLAGTPLGTPSEKYPDVATSNPRVAVNGFLQQHPEFERDTRFLERGIGNFMDGFLRKKV